MDRENWYASAALPFLWIQDTPRGHGHRLWWRHPKSRRDSPWHCAAAHRWSGFMPPSSLRGPKGACDGQDGYRPISRRDWHPNVAERLVPSCCDNCCPYRESISFSYCSQIYEHAANYQNFQSVINNFLGWLIKQNWFSTLSTTGAAPVLQRTAS